jgi:hypothetical protein
MTNQEQSWDVGIGPDFFKKELSTYANWGFAWGRECGQNSLDAGAKNINITCQQVMHLSEDTSKVSWTDDGVGMDKEILLGVFLTLGESNKLFNVCKDCGLNSSVKMKTCAACGWKPVGGFGWAKTLILFAQNSYTIKTSDIILTGVGSKTRFSEGNPHVKGVMLEVEIPMKREYLEANIKQWARWTDTKGTTITLNGYRLRTFMDTDIKGTKPIANVDWATMTLVDGNAAAGMVIRINRQMMMRTYLNGDIKDDIVIDIVGESTQYFTSNRDQLIYSKQEELRKFIETLYKDPRAVTNIKDPVRIFMKGAKGNIEIGVSDEEKAASLKNLLDNPEALAKALATTDVNRSVHDGFDMLVLNNTNQNIPEKWMPGMLSDHAIKLMTRWVSILALVGEVVGFKGRITPGWMFDVEAAAAYTSDCILLNPVNIDENGKMTNRFKFDSPGFNNMVVSAIHEFAHAQGSLYHDETFCCTVGDFSERVLNNWQQFKALRRKV